MTSFMSPWGVAVGAAVLLSSAPIASHAPRHPIAIGPIPREVSELRGAAARAALIRINPNGTEAEFRVTCGWFLSPKKRIRKSLWRVSLPGSIFEWETNPANPAAPQAAVIQIPRKVWVGRVKFGGWRGTLLLRGRFRQFSNGPSTDICGGVLS